MQFLRIIICNFKHGVTRRAHVAFLYIYLKNERKMGDSYVIVALMSNELRLKCVYVA